MGHVVEPAEEAADLVSPALPAPRHRPHARVEGARLQPHHAGEQRGDRVGDVAGQEEAQDDGDQRSGHADQQDGAAGKQAALRVRGVGQERPEEQLVPFLPGSGGPARCERSGPLEGDVRPLSPDGLVIPLTIGSRDRPCVETRRRQAGGKEPTR